MAILHAHPAWCSTEACVVWDDSFDHRSHPMAWKSSVDDFWLTIGMSQFQEVPPGVPDIGHLRVILGLHDLASLDTVGKPRKVETDLTPKDARLLAAALIAAAEQVEAREAAA